MIQKVNFNNSDSLNKIVTELKKKQCVSRKKIKNIKKEQLVLGMNYGKVRKLQCLTMKFTSSYLQQ